MKNSIKKHLTLFFVFFFPSFLTYGLTDADLKELVDERILDGTNMSFKDIPGSNYFIDKFSLNEKEMEMIGIWGFDGIVCKMPYGQKYGPGISIVLYPNRFFCIKKENDENMSIKSIIGKWRVHENKLEFQFKARIIIINNNSGDEMEKYQVEYLKDENKFYPIYNAHDYKIAYFNKSAFNWGSIPQRIMTYCDFTNNDAPRSKLLFDPLGIPPGELRKNSKLSDFLINPRMSDSYLINLMNCW